MCRRPQGCLGGISVRIHPAESLAFTMNSLFRSHSPTCCSLGIHFTAAGVVSQSDSHVLAAVRGLRRFAGKLEASGFISARPVVETWRKRLGVNFSVLPPCFWEPGGWSVWARELCPELGKPAVPCRPCSQPPVKCGVCAGLSPGCDALLQ